MQFVHREEHQQRRQRARHLAELLPEFEALEYGIYAVYPQQRHLATKVRSFVDFLVKRFGVGG